MASQLCQDTYREHQALWRLFDNDPTAKRDFLYRQTIEQGRVKYFVLSERKPVDHSDIWSVETQPYKPKIFEGQKLYFSLRANPVVTQSVERKNPEQYLQQRAKREVKDKSKLTRKRVRHDVVMLEKRRIGYKELPKSERPSEQTIVQETCIAWLSARSEKSGFTFDQTTVVVNGYRQHTGDAGKRKKAIRFSTVDFQGVLTVIDPEIFKRSLANGIGPAKAFGCGLLLLQRC